MTLNEIKLLHAFNAWADNRIFEAVAPLTAEQYMRDMKSSHGSIHGTLTHIVGAEKLWLSRLVGKPDATLLSTHDVASLKGLKEIWERVGYDTAKFLSTMNDKKLLETFSYSTTKGQQYTCVYWQAFQHVADHSTYHRGQIIALLRQLDVTPPNTGLILFYRETNKVH
jgi:uncharacterized damage-inducible protein DinB